jgi:hypothetical protein
MKLEDLHEKQFLFMDEAERICFLEKYRKKRQLQLMTALESTLKKKRTKGKRKTKEKKITVNTQTLQQLKLLGLLE